MSQEHTMQILIHRISSRRTLFVLVAALFALALSACDWQSFGFDAAHTRLNPESIVSPMLTRRWVTQLEGGFGGVETDPTVANGVVYVGDNFHGKIHALDATTGATLWTFETNSDEVDSSPAVANGIVYFGSDDGNIYALNAATGMLVWRVCTDGAVVGSPNVVNGVVYVGSADQKVYALDAATGVTQWTTTTGGPLLSSPAVSSGVVYIGSADH